MEIQIFVIFVVLILALLATQSQSRLPDFKHFNCNRDVRTRPLNLTAMSGYWYEAARVPNMDILKCLNVSVPATVDKDLKLRLEYISTINDQTHAVRDTVSFPWNSNTRNNIYELDFGSTGTMNMSVTYKVMYTDPQFVTILCGYSGISPMPLFKLLTRQQQLNPKVIEYMQAQADKAGIGGQIIWTEQSPDHCNAALRSTARIFIIFTTFLIIMVA